MSPEQFTKIIAELQKGTVHVLSLGQKNLTQEQIQIISEQLKTNQDLVTIDLYDNDLGNEGLELILNALKDHKKLEELYLTDTRINHVGAKKLAEFLEANSSIVDLNLYGNALGLEGAQHLARALAQNTRLKSLDLGKTAIGDGGVACIAEALKNNRSLITLSLYETGMSSVGAQAFAEMLKINKTLLGVSVAVNSFGPQGARAITSALLVNDTLQALEMYTNNLGNEGAMAVAEMLRGNTSLRRLILANNEIAAEGGNAILRALQDNANTGIKKIVLENNECNDVLRDIQQLIASREEPADDEVELPTRDLINYVHGYTININDDTLIRTIALYNKAVLMFNIEGTKINPTPCSALPQFIVKYKSKPDLARAEIKILGASFEAESTVGVFPPLDRTQLEKYKQTCSAQDQQDAQEAELRICDYFSTYSNINLFEIGMRCSGHPVTKKAIVPPPDLSSLTQSQALLVMARLSSEFSHSIKGAIHLSELQQIIIQFYSDNFVLTYGPSTSIHLLNPIALDIPVGFREIVASDETARIVAQLQTFYLQWKDKEFNGPVIPVSCSGFVQQQIQDPQMTGQGLPSANGFFAASDMTSPRPAAAHQGPPGP